MAKRISAYANLRAHELAQITRERGLEKPDVITLSEWADWLEEQDRKTREAAAASGSPPTDASTSEAATPNASPDYNALTKEDAVAEAERRGMTVTSRTTKAEAVDFLLASDGVSEDQQAADNQAENGDGDTDG